MPLLAKKCRCKLEVAPTVNLSCTGISSDKVNDRRDCTGGAFQHFPDCIGSGPHTFAGSAKRFTDLLRPDKTRSVCAHWTRWHQHPQTSRGTGQKCPFGTGKSLREEIGSSQQPGRVAATNRGDYTGFAGGYARSRVRPCKGHQRQGA